MHFSLGTIFVQLHGHTNKCQILSIAISLLPYGCNLFLTIIGSRPKIRDISRQICRHPRAPLSGHAMLRGTGYCWICLPLCGPKLCENTQPHPPPPPQIWDLYFWTQEQKLESGSNLPPHSRKIWDFYDFARFGLRNDW